MEFCIIELVWPSNLSLNWQLLMFWTKLAEKGMLKQKK